MADRKGREQRTMFSVMEAHGYLHRTLSGSSILIEEGRPLFAELSDRNAFAKPSMFEGPQGQLIRDYPFSAKEPFAV